MIALDAGRDRYGNTAYAPPQSDHVDARVLTAGAAELHSVPAGAVFVLFSGTGSFFARIGAAAVLPAADVTDGSAPELNPALRRLPFGTTQIGLVAPADCTVTLAFYAETGGSE